MYVSEISYGNWITHGNQIESDAAIKCVKAALDEGITTFDTADVYAGTKAETVLGKALKGVKRESYELFTKVYWPTGTGKNDRGLSRKHIIESCNASLKRLQTDHIDLYQMHRFDYETPIEESLSAFDDLIRAGKVHYIGFSEWNASQIKSALAIQDARGYNRFVSSQPQYSALWRVIEAEVVPLSKKEGIGQIVWSPMAQGVLTGKYLPGAPAPEGSRAADPSMASIIEKFMSDELLTKVQKLKPLADELGLTQAQFALAWVLQNKNVAGAIVGASRPEQISSNIAAAGVVIPAEVMSQVDEVLGDSIVRDATLTKSPDTRPA